jgi:serine/threonine protein kinase
LEGKPLCNGFDPSRDGYTKRTYLAQLIAQLGHPPKEQLDRGAATERHFDSNGRSNLYARCRHTSDTFLVSLFFFRVLGEFEGEHLVPQNFTLERSLTSLNGEDKILFLELVSKMLQWLPEDRKTTKELLEDPWLYKYVKPL